MFRPLLCTSWTRRSDSVPTPSPRSASTTPSSTKRTHPHRSYLLATFIFLTIYCSAVFATDASKDPSFLEQPIFLNIGGIDHAKNAQNLSWININAQNVSGYTDFIREMHDLAGFEDNSVSAIYSSHTLEHSYEAHIVDVLKEWYRVLRPGGLVLISVPDVETLFTEFLKPDLTLAGSRAILRMVLGGHRDSFDIHHTGFTYALMQQVLTMAGLLDIERVGLMRYHPTDDSSTVFRDKLISLNVAAYKATDSSNFRVVHNAEPWLPNEPVKLYAGDRELHWREVFPDFFKPPADEFKAGL